MKKCLAIAVLLLASSLTTAQAQYTFEYGGRTAPWIPIAAGLEFAGVYDGAGDKAKRPRGEEGDLDRPAQEGAAAGEVRPPQAAPEAATPAAPAPAEQALAPAAAPCRRPAPATTSRGEPWTATAAVAPADLLRLRQPRPLLLKPLRLSPPAPAPVAAPAPPPPQQKQAAAPAASTLPSANSPLGVWLTEEKEGKVRIEQCGPNICGYSVDKKSNQNGEQVLINMKPGKDKWSGRIFDPNSGSTYDSTIALKGTDSLRVQGCAFGGMFCGGQTWTRVN